jgi:hypothetical protein
MPMIEVERDRFAGSPLGVEETQMTRGKRLLGTAVLGMTLAAGVGWTVPASADATGAVPQAQPNTARIHGYEIVKLENANVGNFERRYVYCPQNMRVVGGGAEAQGVNSVLNGSFPTEDGDGWIGIGSQPGYNSVGISVYAICAYV